MALGSRSYRPRIDRFRPVAVTARGFDKAHGVAFDGLPKRRAPSTIGSKARSFSSNSIITKEDVMPAVDAVIVAAIVAAFVIFAGVLAWAEHQTRDLPPISSPR